MNPDQKFFIFDCESVGLHGQTFAVAGGVYDTEGKAIPGTEFSYQCKPKKAMAVSSQRADEDLAWVKANVTSTDEPVKGADCFDPENVQERFWHEYRGAQEEFPGLLVFAECLWPVEARFFLQNTEAAPNVRNWQGPYPFHEIASFMLAAGMDPMATYDRLPEEQPAHEPLADARLSARLLATALKFLAEQKENAWKYAESQQAKKGDDSQ